MTTLYSHQHHHPPTPALDQPTPQSPPPFYMSSNHAPSNNHSDKYHHHHPSALSPPNSSVTSSFSGGPRSLHPSNTIPTPASSAANTVPATFEDNEADMMMMDEGSDTGSNKRRRTSSSSYDRTSQTMPPALRHRGDLPDGIPPPIPTEQELLSQPDVSPYHLVCSNRLFPFHPFPLHSCCFPGHFRDDLLDLYGLRDIANSVARKNPTTGAKNKLRKSFKGFLGGLAGKNVVVTKASQTEVEPGGEAGSGGGDYFATLLGFPDEEWRNLQVIGKEISKGIDMGKLRKGLSMGRGDIPGFDPSVLGLDEESQRRKTPYVGSTTPAIGAAVGTPGHANGSTPGGPSPAGDDRPKRAKRRRDDGGDDDNGVNGSVGGVAGGRNHGPGPGVGPGAIVDGAVWDGEKRKKKRKKVTNTPLNI
ncbi:Rox3-domain-containing protein [Tuber magnatum]|uniref:Mediator of RNA polymerase II transcription subunit 19 n=1 Tax=Tuber magnatum TaxID=42249 RepID=A0A317T4B9_9PEZI|nr:Rox3-domain-containing protein [Tuber magnatum]